jgi:3',5'-cyclic AMP phosphodiesterase CpdA
MRRYTCCAALVLSLGTAACAPTLTPEDLRAPAPPPARLTPDLPDTITFVVYGDNRLSRDRADRAYDSGRRQRRRAVVSAIAGERPHFVLHTGDLVERGGDETLWALFQEDTAPLLRPRFLYPAPGNHEYKGGFSRTYFDLFTETIQGARSYAFRAGPACVIVLDSTSKPAPASRDTSGAHARWFRERLREADQSRFLFVVLHHPPFSTGRGPVARFLFDRHAGHAPRPQERPLREMLADHLARRRARDPRARTLVFSGHSHFYEHYIYRGVDFVVTGGGGAPSHTPSETSPPHRVAAYRGDHYVRVAVAGDSLSFQIKPVGQGTWIQREQSSRE